MKISFAVYKDGDISPSGTEEHEISRKQMRKLLLRLFDIDYILEVYRDNSFAKYSKEEIEELSDAYDIPLDKNNFIEVVKNDGDYDWLIEEILDEIDYNQDYEEFKEAIEDAYIDEVM